MPTFFKSHSIRSPCRLLVVGDLLNESRIKGFLRDNANFYKKTSAIILKGTLSCKIL